MNRRMSSAGGLAAALLLAGGAAVADRLEYTFAAPAPELRPMADGTTRVTVPGAGTSARPGEPALPGQVLRLALPPDADPASVTVEVTPLGVERLPGTHDVTPAPPAGLIGRGTLDWGPAAARIADGRDPLVWGSDLPFPAAWGEAHPSLGGLRRYRFATVRLHPVRYRPVSGLLERAAGFRVTVTFRREARPARPLDADCGGEALAARLLHNHEQARLWYDEPCLGPPVTPTGLAIITTDSIADASDGLSDYADMREDQGWNVVIATEAQWDTSTGEQLDSRADRIRAWLRARWVEEDFGFALLVGNPDPSGQMQHNVPMKPCATADETSVTDFYYADLSGHWDQSGNGVVCDFGFDDLDVSGEGAIDFVPEIYVGRIPCYSDGAAAVDEILARIIAYEQDSADGDIHWRRRMMLPDSIYFFENQYGDTGYRRWDGATVGEWFIRDQLGPRGMEWTTLYEREGVSPSNFPSHLPLDSYNVVDQWNRGYGLVFWTGHGSNTGVYRLIWTNDDNENQIPDWNPYELDSPSFMESDYLHMLQGAPPPFVIHGSCSNGYPETATNLGYTMLRRGAIGTVSASRSAMTWHWPNEITETWEKPETWDGDVIDIVTEYSVNLLDGMEAGRALGEAIALTTDGQGDNSWYQKSIQNLYGDPLVRLVMCREDGECDNGLFCDGDELCDSGSCVPSAAPACAPTADCDIVTCDEEADLCVPDPSCAGEPDAGDDAGQPASEVTGGAAGCRLAPAPGARGLLAAILGLARPGR